MMKSLPSSLRRSLAVLVIRAFFLVIVAAVPEVQAGGLVSLTFDDGLTSVREYAFPILQKYGLPATVGVIVSRMESDDPEFMRSGDLRTLAAAGWEIASHSVNHRRNPQLPPRYQDEPLQGVHREPGLPAEYETVYEYPVLAGVLAGDKPLRRVMTRDELAEGAGTYFYDDAVQTVAARPFGEPGVSPDGLRAVSSQRELEQSRLRLAQYGFDVRTFIVPFNDWTASLRDMSGAYYGQVLSGGDDLNLPGATDRLWMRRYVVTGENSLEDVKNLIRQGAVKQNGWVILCLHGVGDESGWEPWPDERLEGLAKWLRDQDLQVVTVAEGAKAFFSEPVKSAVGDRRAWPKS